jgi:hypothetical protein
MRDVSIVVGIDVGGPKKGFHAVALRTGRYHDQMSTLEPQRLADWCRALGARAVAVDAPCRWSLNGRARPAERELMAAGIWCFSTPSREAALAHPKNHYGWMLNGAKLYDRLEADFPLFLGRRASKQRRVWRLRRRIQSALRLPHNLPRRMVVRN